MKTSFETLQEGFIFRCQPNTSQAVAVGSRCAVTRGGELLCTYMVQSALGINDFKVLRARSADLGQTWVEEGAIWPHLHDRWSIFGSVSRAPDGTLFFYGARTPIDQPGESLWSEATQGLKQNELFWAKSADDGRTWSEPTVIPMPFPGSAEAPGALCVTRKGTWLACYAPYHTFDPAVRMDRGQIVLLISRDGGRTWQHTAMLRFARPDSIGAEAWVIELADGRCLGTAWEIGAPQGGDRPNPFALSLDGGLRWTSAQSTGILGQSTALAALPDGRALFIYNQRKHGEVGVRLAVARPTETDFGMETDQLIWKARAATQGKSSGEHSSWTDFAFGEPSITPLTDGTLLVTLWCVQPDGAGIRFVRLRMG